MTEIIGGSSRGRHCLNCGDEFERPEFSAYMMRLRSMTIDCFRCQTENYLVPVKGPSFGLALLGALGMGLLASLIFWYAVYVFATSNTRLGLFMAFFAGAGGVLSFLAVTRLVLKIHHWKNADQSLDRKHKSIADYE